MPNLIEAIQERCNYIRETIIPAYDEIGPSGAFGKMMLRADIKDAESAIAGGDPIAMIATLKTLRETCERAL
jgi:hypothetical protein